MLPITSTLPSEGLITCAIAFNKVLLPAPLCPIIPIRSPCLIVRLIFLSATNSLCSSLRIIALSRYSLIPSIFSPGIRYLTVRSFMTTASSSFSHFIFCPAPVLQIINKLVLIFLKYHDTCYKCQHCSETAVDDNIPCRQYAIINRAAKCFHKFKHWIDP